MGKKRNAAICRKCATFIESKFTHDFVWCQCQAIFVDGGSDYVRRGGDWDNFVELTFEGEEHA